MENLVEGISSTLTILWRPLKRKIIKRKRGAHLLTISTILNYKKNKWNQSRQMYTIKDTTHDSRGASDS